MINWGYVPSTLTTLPFPVTTHAQTGAAVAPSTAFETADFILYKNGSATQRTSQAGWSITSPFDSITGLHMLLIDLTDNTDAGFYSAGAFYTLVLSPDETVDGLAVVRVVGTFIIGPVAANATQLLGTAWLTPGTAGTPDVNAKLIGGTAQTGRDIGASVLLSNGTGAGQVKLASGYVAMTWADIAAPTTTVNLSGTTIKTATDVATILGTPAGASLSVDIAAVKTDTAAIKVVTDKFVFTVANQVDSNVITKTGFTLSATGSAAMTESVRADGATGTLNQLLYEILLNLTEFTNSGLSRTLNGLSGTPGTVVYTYDSATTPSAITRTA